MPICALARIRVLATSLLVAAVAVGCPAPKPSPASAAPVASASMPPTAKSTAGTATLEIENDTAVATMVYVAFGADSAITTWPSCPVTSRLNCQMPLAAKTTVAVPLGGQYLNATFSFDGPVTCGATKAEANLNNPKWYDIADVSLVDGFSSPLVVKAGDRMLEALRKTGNEKAFGVYPLGCDICTARQNPPCGMSPTREGCKAGPDQYHPDVPCQFQGSVMGGGTAVRIIHL